MLYILHWQLVSLPCFFIIVIIIIIYYFFPHIHDFGIDIFNDRKL